MIFTSVDVEALRYLRARGEHDPELESFLLENIAYGYQRQLNYRHEDGWFAAKKTRPTGSLWLTSYCLSVFSKAREFTTVDPTILSEAAAWIIGHQKADGGWEPVGFVSNRNLYGGLSGNYGLTAFVTLALAGYESVPDAVLARARAWLESHLAEAETPHSLALGAYALAALGSPAADVALDRLEAHAIRDEWPRLHWDPVPVETTAYAALAFHAAGRTLEGGAAASWLPTRKNCRGGFGNTQDTVTALRALVEDALLAQSSTDASVTVRSGGAVLESLRIDGSNIDVLRTFAVDPGQGLSVGATGKGSVTVQLAKVYNVPTEALRSRGGLSLDVDYERTRIAVGDRVGAVARISYAGTKEKTNMALAEIGIPTGLRPDRRELESLVGENKVDRIDVDRRRIVVYLDNVAAGETITLPIVFHAAFPARSAAAPSSAYDYYDPLVDALDAGVALVIGEPGEDAPFLRGDANEDGEVDVSDAVRTFEVLFLGSGPASCPDSLDGNDDGATDVSDPIYLLDYLFAGGSPPPPPFPQIGGDPTDDGLECLVR